MSLFFETIRIENGIPQHLHYHNLRLNRTIRENFSLCPSYDLRDFLEFPPEAGKGTFRCKICYNTEIREITFTPYQRRSYRMLRLIEADIDYRYKSCDRNALEKLYERRGECDDVLIVKNGLLSDTTIANIALFDGLRWYTPKSPLLEGTTRARLLEKGILHTADLRAEDLHKYTKFALMNAMTGFYQLKNITFKF